MRKTVTYNWEKAKSMLLEKGVSEVEIDKLTDGKKDNRDKYEALKPLLNQHGLKLDLRANWEIARAKLIDAGVSEAEINALTDGKKDNRKKHDALKPLLIKHGIEVVSLTRKYNWEIARAKLLEAGVSEEEINARLDGKEDTKDKYDALKPMLDEHKIELSSPDNSPSLQSYFNKAISDLLIRRKKLVNIIKDKDFSSIENKTVSELSLEELEELQSYFTLASLKKELEAINISLEKKGIIIKDKFGPK